MITLRKITLENRREMFKLEVGEAQRRFVASNLSSVASCYVLLTNGSQPIPLIIYADDVMVGFVMIVYGATGYDMPLIADGNYCILRLMIDAKYQGRGYGQAAMAKILDYIRTRPAGPADHCWISYSPENAAARKVYARAGFVENGELCNDETIAVTQL